MKLLLSLLALVALSALHFAEAAPKENSSTKINCFISFLKENRKLDSDFPDFPGEKAEDCDDIIKKNTEKICEDVVKTKKLKNMKKCVVSYLKEHKYPENVMKNTVVMSSPALSSDEKAKRSNIIRRQNNLSIERTIEFCMMHKFFSDRFDNMINDEDHEEETEDPVIKYCIRKHVVDKNEIDTNVYQVQINKDNIDTEKAKETCNGFYEHYSLYVRNAIELMIEKHIKLGSARICVKGKVFKTRVIDEALMLEVLSELELSDEQKATEKKKFMEYDDNLMKSVLKCVDVPK